MPGLGRRVPTEAKTMEDTIRRYIEESFLIEFGEQITAETDLFETQIIDSFGFVELVSYLESTFRVKITDEDDRHHVVRRLVEPQPHPPRLLDPVAVRIVGEMGAREGDRHRHAGLAVPAGRRPVPLSYRAGRPLSDVG